jgi:hypothetical protein
MAEQLDYFRGQCMNCAAVLVAKKAASQQVEALYAVAKALFDEGIKQDFMNWGKTEAEKKQVELKDCPKCHDKIPIYFTYHNKCGWTSAENKESLNGGKPK